MRQACSLLILLTVVGCSPTAAADLTEAPSTEEPTPAQHPGSTDAPTLVETPTDSATFLPAPTPIGDEADYVVQFVPLNDVLNVRAGAGTDFEVLGELNNGDHVRITGEAIVTDHGMWVPIEAPDYGITGWVSYRYLVTHDLAAFCGDPRPLAIIEEVREAVRTKDSERFAASINPLDGLTIGSIYWHKKPTINFPRLSEFFTDTAEYDFGKDAYSDQPVMGSLRDFITPLMEQNLLPDNVSIACNESQDTKMLPGYFPGGGQGLNGLPFYSVFRPASEGHELEWGAWAFGFVPTEDAVTLRYLMYYTWTP